jgi:hypothetical protein
MFFWRGLRWGPRASCLFTDRDFSNCYTSLFCYCCVIQQDLSTSFGTGARFPQDTPPTCRTRLSLLLYKLRASLNRVRLSHFPPIPLKGLANRHIPSVLSVLAHYFTRNFKTIFFPCTKQFIYDIFNPVIMCKFFSCHSCETRFVSYVAPAVIIAYCIPTWQWWRWKWLLISVLACLEACDCDCDVVQMWPSVLSRCNFGRRRSSAIPCHVGGQTEGSHKTLRLPKSNPAKIHKLHPEYRYKTL